MKRTNITALLIFFMSIMNTHSFAYDIYSLNADNRVIYYNWINNHTELEVTSNPNKYTGTIHIPSSVTYNGKTYSVTSIGSGAFLNCLSLTSVTIPNSVTSIGSYAFQGCSSLTSVTIPSSVWSIGSGAFLFCSGLTSITIPNIVTSIENHVFSGCSGLTSVTIPNNVRSIEDGAFSGCSGLTSITIPSSVTSIGSNAFEGCSSLTQVTINSNDFISKSFTSSLSLVNIFGNQVETYILGNNVTSIGDNAFYNCTGLISITIPSSVTSIGSNAFEGCSGLTQVTINSNTIISKSFTSSLSLVNIFGNQVETYILGNNVKSIGDYAFNLCKGLITITIPSSVTSIGKCAFYGCFGLTSITIPNSVTYIGDLAFMDCI